MSNKNHPYIDIICYLNNLPYTITLDKNASVSQVINALFSSFSLEKNLYNISYNDKTLKTNDNRILKNLIGKNSQPTFIIYQKSKIQKIAKELSDLPQQRTKSQRTNVIIYNAISKEDIENILSNFNNSNKLSANNRGIIATYNDNFIKIAFNNKKNANGFESYLKYIKIMNPIYKDMSFKIDNVRSSLSPFFKNKMQNSETINTNFRTSPYTMSKGSTNNSKIYSNEINVNNSYINSNIYMKNGNVYDNDNNYYYKNNNNFNNYSNRNDNIKNNRYINNYFSHQEFVRNSSPYVTEHEKKVLEEKNSKKKFLNKNGFITSVGNYSMKPHYIENYVQQTPSEFPLNHKFREEDKEKWMTPKGFIK